MSEHGERTIILPDGRVVQVLYTTPAVPVVRVPRRADVCPDCCSDLVQPVAWTPAPAGTIKLTRRCPECEWSGASLFDEGEIALFEESIAGATDVLVSSLARLVSEREAFDAALAALHRDAAA